MTTEYAPSERANMHEQQRRGIVAEGRHRAICQHPFVPHPRGEDFGCNRPEDHEPDVRCGYYRRHHATMLAPEHANQDPA